MTHRIHVVEKRERISRGRWGKWRPALRIHWRRHSDAEAFKAKAEQNAKSRSPDPTEYRVSTYQPSRPWTYR